MEVSEDIQDISLSATNAKSLASFGFYFFHRMAQRLTLYIIIQKLLILSIRQTQMKRNIP